MASNFTRPTLTQIIQRVGNDFETEGGIDPTQYNAIAEGVKYAVAGTSHVLHGHLEQLAVQYHPFTAFGDSFRQHAAVFGVAQLPATVAGGTGVFSGTNGSVIPSGTVLQRSDGVEYVTDAEATIAAGTASVAITAVKPGVDGNADVTAVISLATPIEGVVSTVSLTGDGLTGGNEVEDEEAFFARYLRAVQEPVVGGSATDYETWALSFPGVTRAWSNPLGMGDGTVVVWFMMDNKYADGIPTAADATALFDYMDPLRPAGMSGLYVVPPNAEPLNPTIALSPNTTAVQAAVEAQLRDLIRDEIRPEDGAGKGKLLISRFREAVSTATGENDNNVVSPAADVTPAVGGIITLGTPTWQTL